MLVSFQTQKVTKDSKLDIDAIHQLAQYVAKFENWLKIVISGDHIPEDL